MKPSFKEFLEKIDYKDPSKYDFDGDDKIDSNIRETIKNINKSSWCWTLWSCEGHIHSENEKSLPYFVFVVKKKCIPVLLGMLYNTLDPQVDVVTPFPLINTNYISLSWGFTDDKYAIMNVHWSDLFLEDKKSHDKLLSDFYDLSFKILEAKL